MEENTVPNYCLTKTNGGKIRKQLQTNSPTPKSTVEPESKFDRNDPKATAFKSK